MVVPDMCKMYGFVRTRYNRFALDSKEICSPNGHGRISFDKSILIRLAGLESVRTLHSTKEATSLSLLPAEGCRNVKGGVRGRAIDDNSQREWRQLNRSIKDQRPVHKSERRVLASIATVRKGYGTVVKVQFGSASAECERIKIGYATSRTCWITGEAGLEEKSIRRTERNQNGPNARRSRDESRGSSR